MCGMRRGLVHALAWSLATGAAVTLSWWGVHTVLSGTVYDPPRALPLPAGSPADLVPAETAIGDPVTSSTRRPSTTPPASAPPSPSSSAPKAAAPPSSRPAAPTTATPAPTTTAPAPGGSSVRSYPSDGGRVTFDLGETSAELVSASPASGWQMQVWKQPTWIRVTFTRDGREVSVFCLWHDSAPRVQIEERAV
ncbi:hypothetical protein NC315_14140 [Streptomyces sp. G2]|uniref:hypothetical protein n=1 Tax=Streptomyces TaxID=1883 RepID=UPI00202F8564|nr:hypothetical protein [Streptomyces sp. G2]MCM1946507.1 hypothetical protein [Streptomyces sp. G2]